MRCSFWSRIITIAVASLALAASALAAPPPPPPPPPADMPTQIDGYDTYAIRISYFAWIARRMGDARGAAQELAPWPGDLNDSYRRSDGPAIRVFNGEQGGEYFGHELRLHERCILREAASTCTWVARHTQVRLGAPADFLRDHFNAARAVAYLRAHDIAPTRIRAAMQSFGLDDPMANPLVYVDVRDVTQASCPGIAEALSIAEQRAGALRVDRVEPRRADAPPPPPLHSYVTIITLPSWYVHDRSGRTTEGGLTLSGVGDPLIADMIDAIETPLRDCGV